jgi:SAM-dependent methyltransferase
MNQQKASMIQYYAQRALEYEKIYNKSERQEDLIKLKEVLSKLFGGKEVLEVACGTGYWTQFIAKSAKSILATDINSELLEIAQQKDYGSCQVQFTKSDAYFLDNISCQYTGGFHGFWWSHISIQQIDSFLRTFHSKLLPDAIIVIIDNIYIEGNSTPISRNDVNGNTYQLRKLRDGTQHEILKNYPSLSQINDRLQPFAYNIKSKQMEYYWYIEYKNKPQVVRE